MYQDYLKKYITRAPTFKRSSKLTSSLIFDFKIFNVPHKQQNDNGREFTPKVISINYTVARSIAVGHWQSINVQSQGDTEGSNRNSDDMLTTWMRKK